MKKIKFSPFQKKAIKEITDSYYEEYGEDCFDYIDGILEEILDVTALDDFEDAVEEKVIQRLTRNQENAENEKQKKDNTEKIKEKFNKKKEMVKQADLDITLSNVYVYKNPTGVNWSYNDFGNTTYALGEVDLHSIHKKKNNETIITIVAKTNNNAHRINYAKGRLGFEIRKDKEITWEEIFGKINKKAVFTYEGQFKVLKFHPELMIEFTGHSVNGDLNNFINEKKKVLEKVLAKKAEEERIANRKIKRRFTL